MVIPSIWLFLRDMDESVPEYFLGLAVGGYALTSMLLQPVIGIWLDSRFIRETVTFQMWVVMVGNLLYFFSTSIYTVLVARIICGVGGTVFLSMSVYIIRTTTEQERSGAFGVMQIAMMGGIVIGPALNYPISLIPRMSIGGWLEVSAYNSVGIIMVMVQLLAMAAFHVFFIEPTNSSPPTQSNMSGIAGLRSVLSFGVVALIVTESVAIFNQAALEVVMTPILLSYYGFRQVANSIFYTAMTVYMIILFSVLGGCVAPRLQDRTLIFLGWVWLCGGIVILFFGERFALPHIPVWLFAVGIFVYITSGAFFEIAVGSLFSKLVERQGGKQATSQSILMMFQTLGTLIGPLIASPILTRGGLTFVLVMLFGAWALGFIMFLAAFKWLKIDPPPTADAPDALSSVSDSEVL